MAWIRRTPRCFGSIEAALGRFRTVACSDMAVAYRDLLVETGGRIPRKNGLDVARFRSLMSDLVLTAIIKPDKCIYRIAGEAMKDRIGMNPVGRNYYDFVPAERRENAIAAMHMVIDRQCAFRAEIEQRYTDGRSKVIEAFAAPLLSDEPGVDGFILFGDRVFVERRPVLDEGPLLQGANVVARDLIDLGRGVDPDFYDLVQDR